MGWRFRKKIGPFNITKKGISSVSLGGRGLRVNINKKGTQSTFSLPDTGLSYQTKRTPHGEHSEVGGGIAWLLIGLAIVAVLAVALRFLPAEWLQMLPGLK